MLGDKHFRGDGKHRVEGGFTVVSISVEYMRLVFGLSFIVKSSRFSYPSCSFVILCEVGLRFGLSTKEMNTIDMMSYGWDEQPVRLVGFEFKIGYKERTRIEND